MNSTTSSAGLRWAAFLLLAGAAVPMVMSWRSGPSAAIDRSAAAPGTNGRAGLPADPAWVSPNQIEVELQPGDGAQDLAGVSRECGVPLTWDSPEHAETEVAVGAVPPNETEQQALAALRQDGRVVAADALHTYREPESPVLASEIVGQDTNRPGPAEDTGRWKPNDPRYGEQWNFQMVKCEQAWEISRGKGVTVAIIDTGVAYGDTRKGPGARDFKQTGFAPGYDFVNSDAVPYDDNGHGTHVAGTVAESTDNGEGVAGLAFDARVMPLKVLSAGGGGSSAAIAEAIRWAADHGANVINMSLGSPFPDKLMAAACEYAHDKGVTIVCAAGNSGREGVGYPAAYPQCIAVSAVGPDGNLSFYSSWGKEIAIAAPGGDTQKGGPAGAILQNTILTDSDGNRVDGYFGFQGTSMASPHVAAVAALVESCGVKDPDDVRCVLMKSASKKSPASKYGAGIVDAERAVKLASNIHGDGVTRFWMVMALFGACFAIGKLRERAGGEGGYPMLGTAALAFGLLFPDWLTGFLGLSSHWNLIGHSILIPGALLLMGADDAAERRFLGWMSLGLCLHLGWEFLRGTTPMGLDWGSLSLAPWVVANLSIGAGMLVSGLSANTSG